MGKVIVDYNEEGTVTILSDSELEIPETVQPKISADILVPVIEIADDIDMKPDDTLEESEEEDEEEGDSENVQ